MQLSRIAKQLGGEMDEATGLYRLPCNGTGPDLEIELYSFDEKYSLSVITLASLLLCFVLLYLPHLSLLKKNVEKVIAILVVLMPSLSVVVIVFLKRIQVPLYR